MNLITALLIITMLSSISCNDSKQRSSADGGREAPTKLRLYIGTYAGEEVPGIYLYEFHTTTKKFHKIQEIAGQNNPSYLAIHPSSGFLYAVNQTADFEGRNEGSISAFKVDSESGMLTFMNRQSSLGARPCHVSVLPCGNFVAAANYSGGSIALLPVSGDGSLEKASGFKQHSGSSIHPRRQNSAHAHSVYPSRDGRYLFAADLGTDKVMIYTIDDEGRLVPNSPSAWAEMKPGAGPRHLAVHPEREWIYIINELNSTVTRLVFDEESGIAEVKESVSTLPEEYSGENFCADIRIHPDGMFLYASNRGHNSIAVFRLDDKGRPELTGCEPVRGEWPRNFNIEPSGRFLFAANQNSGNITVFEINRETGELNYTGEEVLINQPVSIVFPEDQ